MSISLCSTAILAMLFSANSGEQFGGCFQVAYRENTFHGQLEGARERVINENTIPGLTSFL
jgi:hypothetical protein